MSNSKQNDYCIGFYQPLLNCFITTTKNILTANKIPFLFSSRMTIVCCDILSAKNIDIIGSSTDWSGWTFNAAEQFQFADPLYEKKLQLSQIFNTDELIKANLNDKSMTLLQETRKLLDCIIKWTDFFNLLETNQGALFIKDHFEIVSIYDDELQKCVKECEKILYLENEITKIHNKIFKLLKDNKKILRIYEEYRNSL